MACPNCGCKETYQFDGWHEDHDPGDESFDRCAACGAVFDIEDHTDEDDEPMTDAEFDARHGGRELLPIEQVAYEHEGAERFARFHRLPGGTP